MLEVAALTETSSALEVVVERPQGVGSPTDLAPRLAQVLGLLQALDTFIDAVAVGWLNRGSRGSDDDLVVYARMSQELLMHQASPRSVAVIFLNTRIGRISMNSPLTVELLVSGLGSAGVVSAVVYLFKNPTKIGEWFPKVQASWYNGRAEAERARNAYETLRKARTKIHKLES